MNGRGIRRRQEEGQREGIREECRRAGERARSGGLISKVEGESGRFMG